MPMWLKGIPVKKESLAISVVLSAIFSLSAVRAEEATPAATAPAATQETADKTESSADTPSAPSEASPASSSTSDKTQTPESASPPVPDAAAPAAVAPPAVSSPKPATPADRPKPPGFDAAVKLYNSKNYAAAQKKFEQFVKSGVADVESHNYLAACLFQLRQYSKAQKEYEWLAKYSTKNLTLRRNSQNTARTLAYYRSGICPASCLKANDPRWASLPGHSGKWIKFPDKGGYKAWSTNHIGEVIEYVNGVAQSKGRCTVCGGRGTVGVLLDGEPAPW